MYSRDYVYVRRYSVDKENNLMVLVSRYVCQLGLAKLLRTFCQAVRSVVPLEPRVSHQGHVLQLQQRDGLSFWSLLVTGWYPVEVRQRFAFISHP